MRHLAKVTVLATVLFMASGARAELITWAIAGDAFNSEFSDGLPWFALLSIDDDPTSSTGNSAGYDIRENDGNPYGLVLSIGGEVATARNVEINVWNDASGVFGVIDFFRITAWSDELGFDFLFDLIWFDSDATAISSTALFPDPSAGWDTYCFGGSGCQVKVRSAGSNTVSVERVEVFKLPFFVPIPEPSALTLFAVGLFLIVLGSRRTSFRKHGAIA